MVTGAAFVFQAIGTTWTQQGAPAHAIGGVSGDDFGASVSLSGTTARG